MFLNISDSKFNLFLFPGGWDYELNEIIDRTVLVSNVFQKDIPFYAPLLQTENYYNSLILFHNC